MNVDLMGSISLLVVISLFVVLVSMIGNITRVLRRTGANLQEALAVTAAIRKQCEQISPGINAMNNNLYGVAAGLQGIGDATEQRVARVADQSP